MATRNKITVPPMPSDGSAPRRVGDGRVGFQGIEGRVGQELIGGMQPGFSGDVFNAQSVNEFQYTRYYEGQEQEPFDWDPDRKYGLQQALYAAGYLGKESVGDEWRDTHANAYKRALADANRYGVSVEELLGTIAAQGGGPGGSGSRGGGGGGLGAAGVTDEDITALANKVAQGVLGRNLRADEIGNFIPAFRGALSSGTTPQVSAENLIRNDIAPSGEAGAHDVGNVMGVLSQLLGG